MQYKRSMNRQHCNAMMCHGTSHSGNVPRMVLYFDVHVLCLELEKASICCRMARGFVLAHGVRLIGVLITGGIEPAELVFLFLRSVSSFHYFVILSRTTTNNVLLSKYLSFYIICTYTHAVFVPQHNLLCYGIILHIALPTCK